MSKLKKWGFSRFITRPDRGFCLKMKLILITRLKQESIFRSDRLFFKHSQVHANRIPEVSVVWCPKLPSQKDVKPLLCLFSRWKKLLAGYINWSNYDNIFQQYINVEMSTSHLKDHHSKITTGNLWWTHSIHFSYLNTCTHTHKWNYVRSSKMILFVWLLPPNSVVCIFRNRQNVLCKCFSVIICLFLFYIWCLSFIASGFLS